MKRIAMVVIITALWSISSYGQSFQNLDFESAYGLPENPGNGVLVPVANALPDWTAFVGPASSNNPISSVTYADNINGTYTLVSLVGGGLALSGGYSAWLQEYASISQMGLVPNNAGSLQFEASGETAPVAFSVSLGGQKLSYSEISTGSGYNVFSATIPAGMDGQREALTFDIGNFDVLLDNIEFMPAPEPSEYAVIGLGVIFFGFYRGRKLVCAMRNSL